MASQNVPKNPFFSQNFDTKSSLELNNGWDHSENLFHSQRKWLTKNTAPLNLSQIRSLFRKWCTSVSKVGKITAYVISCDVIGLDAGLGSDISSERYGPKLSKIYARSLDLEETFLEGVSKKNPEKNFYLVKVISSSHYKKWIRNKLNTFWKSFRQVQISEL